MINVNATDGIELNGDVTTLTIEWYLITKALIKLVKDESKMDITILELAEGAEFLLDDSVVEISKKNK